MRSIKRFDPLRKRTGFISEHVLMQLRVGRRRASREAANCVRLSERTMARHVEFILGFPSAGTTRKSVTPRIVFSALLPLPTRIDSVNFHHPTLSRPSRHRQARRV